MPWPPSTRSAPRRVAEVGNRALDLSLWRLCEPPVGTQQALGKPWAFARSERAHLIIRRSLIVPTRSCACYMCKPPPVHTDCEPQSGRTRRSRYQDEPSLPPRRQDGLPADALPRPDLAQQHEASHAGTPSSPDSYHSHGVTHTADARVACSPARAMYSVPIHADAHIHMPMHTRAQEF